MVVRENAHVLDPEGLGAVLCGLAAEFPESAGRGGEHSDMGECLCDGCADGWSSGGEWVGAFAGTQGGGKRKRGESCDGGGREDGGRRRGRGEEGVMIS